MIVFVDIYAYSAAYIDIEYIYKFSLRNIMIYILLVGMS